MDTTTWEYAMLKMPNGTAVPRLAAKQKLLKGWEAVARNGGRIPVDQAGRSMLWGGEERGWVTREPAAPPTRRAGRPLAELMARQRFVDLGIRQERLDQELRDERALLTNASELAWCHARQFRAGFPEPSLDAPGDTLTGWRLARRGYDRPPAWLLQERRDARPR